MNKEITKYPLIWIYFNNIALLIYSLEYLKRRRCKIIYRQDSTKELLLILFTFFIIHESCDLEYIKHLFLSFFNCF